MFWNDPNLYSVAFKDLPNYRYFHPYTNYPTPQYTPQFAPQYTPQMFTPQWPVTPWMQTPPVTPFFNPMLTAYNFNYPYFDRYRTFGL